jgi:hypothetical protein
VYCCLGHRARDQPCVCVSRYLMHGASTHTPPLDAGSPMTRGMVCTIRRVSVEPGTGYVLAIIMHAAPSQYCMRGLIARRRMSSV